MVGELDKAKHPRPSIFRSHPQEYSADHLVQVDYSIHKWTDLAIRLRSNDNSFEDFLQFVVYVILIFLWLTSTPTVTGFEKLLDGNKVFVI